MPIWFHANKQKKTRKVLHWIYLAKNRILSFETGAGKLSNLLIGIWLVHQTDCMGTPVSPILTRAENGKDKWDVQRKQSFGLLALLLRASYANIRTTNLLKNNDRI